MIEDEEMVPLSAGIMALAEVILTRDELDGLSEDQAREWSRGVILKHAAREQRPNLDRLTDPLVTAKLAEERWAKRVLRHRKR